MKLGTAITQLKRGMTYYPELAKLIGGASPAILVCALVWKDSDIDQSRSDEKKLTVIKQLGALGKETGLTDSEMRGARVILEQIGVLSCTYRRLERNIEFVVNIEKIDMLGEVDTLASVKTSDEHLSKQQMTPDETADGHLLKQQIDHSIENKNENKRENKASRHRLKRAEALSSVFALPDWVPKELWDAFEEVRKKLRKPLTYHARELTIEDLKKLEESGEDPIACLKQSIQRGWQGVFPLHKNGNGNGYERKLGADW